MSDLLDRLQDMVDFKHDDMDVAREAIEEIVKLEAQHEEQAAEIARLRARVAELEGVLDQLLDDMRDGLCVCQQAKDEARAALTGGKDE